MNFKTTYILFGLLVLVLGIFLITQLVGRKSADRGTYAFPSLHTKTADVKATDIDLVEVELNRPKSEKFAFVRSDKGWRAKEPNVKADADAINQLIRQVMDAKADDRADLPKDAKEAGLEPPAAAVTLVQKGGEKKWTLHVGKVGYGSDAYAFVNSSERPKDVLAVRRGALDALLRPRDFAAADPEVAFKTLNDYRSRDLLASNTFDYQSVNLEGAKLGQVILKRQGTENRWVFEKPPYGEADYQGSLIGPGPEGAQQGGVSGLLSSLASLRVAALEDFVADDVRDLSKYGLDDKDPDRLRIEVQTQSSPAVPGEEKKDTVTTVLLIGKKVEEKEEKKPDEKKAEEREEKYYAALDEGDKYPKSVVKVSGKPREQIVKVLQNPKALRTRDLVSLDPAKVNGIDWIEVNNGKETFQLKKTGAGSWELIDKAGSARKADGNVVERLIDLVRDRRTIKDYPDDKKTDAELGLEKPAATVAFWIDSQKEAEKKEPEKKEEDKKNGKEKDKKDDKKEPKKEEKKEAAPTKPSDPPAVRLAFGNKDKENVYVLRELRELDKDKKEKLDRVRAAVPEALLTKVTQEKVAYLDRRLPDFPRDKVNRVVIVRDGQTTELEKEEKDGKTAWKFKKPDTLAGRSAESAKVVRILEDLSGLFAEKLLSESATESELDGYGLKSPAVQVTVAWPTDDKKVEERTYSFGKADDKTGQLHARMSGLDWVFLVRDSVLNPIKDELADTMVFTFDPEKVKRLKVTGWQKIGFPVTLDLEREAKGKWTAKTAPPGFQLDANKTEGFLKGLSNLKATRFVAHKSGAKPEHELEVPKGALEIEITVEGEKEPITLTVRDPKSDAKDKALYAKSNKLPGDIFVVPEAAFKPVLEAPGYFGQAGAAK
jgi:hypothetical protein